VLPLAVLAVAGIVAAGVALTHGPNLVHVAAALGWPLAYVQSAHKWAKRYGMPFDWVLTTISVESGGNPNASGDEGGRSVGLMQVNTAVHPVTREQMRVPDTNIQYGTMLLKQFHDEVLVALGGRKPPAPIDVITRLAYKGPATVKSALRRGENPVNLPWGPDAAMRWRRHMGTVRAAIAGRALTPSKQTV